MSFLKRTYEPREYLLHRLNEHLWDDDRAGNEAYKGIAKANAMYIDIWPGFSQDQSKSVVMDNLFDPEELKNLSQELSDNNIKNYATYKDILRILYENKNIVHKYKHLLTKTLENFSKLENSILCKLKLIRKNS